MPQGKGTYGSQVGRPSKKKYNKGGNVDPFSTRNPEGVPAEQLAEMMENQNMANEGMPTSNAMDRSQVSPDVTEYKEGGKVKSKKIKYGPDVTDVVKDVEYMKKYKDESESDLPYLHRIDMAQAAIGKKYSIKEKKKRILKGKKK